MKPVLLDTHYWVWLQTGNTDELSSAARTQLTDLQRSKSLYLSAISVLELARLVADGHIDLGTSVDRFVAEATEDDGLQILPLTPHILIESTRLPGDLHRDPADRLLVATAREHKLTLMTRDRQLQSYGKKGNLKVLSP